CAGQRSRSEVIAHGESVSRDGRKCQVLEYHVDSFESSRIPRCEGTTLRGAAVASGTQAVVPGAGIEPACRSSPARRFKRLVSTDFTTRACRPFYPALYLSEASLAVL